MHGKEKGLLILLGLLTGPTTLTTAAIATDLGLARHPEQAADPAWQAAQAFAWGLALLVAALGLIQLLAGLRGLRERPGKGTSDTLFHQREEKS